MGHNTVHRSRLQVMGCSCSSTNHKHSAVVTWQQQELSRCIDTDSLQQWLRSRGSHVIKVKLQSPVATISTLPCPRLEWLVLEDISMDLRPGSQLLQDLSAATKLQHLHLDDIEFQGEPDLWAFLEVMPGLQHLHVANVRVYGSPDEQQQQPPANTAAAHGGRLLTRSHLWSTSGVYEYWFKHITNEGMQFLCKLTKLQSLELRNMAKVTAAGLAGLRNLPALKRLVLEGVSCGISTSAVPAFTQLTALTCLKLAWTGSRAPPDPPDDLIATRDFHPSVLADMTQLEELHLHHPQPAGGVSGAAELLARLAQLTKLQVLHLAQVDCLLLCPHTAFSSLTSSSVLRSLTWRHNGNQPGPWQHVFPDRLRLSTLTELETEDGRPWEAPGLDRLVSSCSQLQKLSLYCTPGLQLTALLQLTDLVQLRLSGWRQPDSSTMASLAQLSALQRLQRLSVTHPYKFTGKLFIPLTALTQLTYLALPEFTEHRDDLIMEELLFQIRGEPLPYVDPWSSMLRSVITSMAPAGAPPDVWSQLLSCCEACITPQYEEEEEEEPLAGLG